jgi:gliding motility-associated-like protein
MRLYFSLCMILIGSFAFAQNLIPDPMFHESDFISCDWPPDIMDQAVYWYNMSGTSDWFDRGCSVNPTPDGFWTGEAGTGYVGFISALFTTGLHYSEGIGTPLLAPMEAGNFYYLELRLRSKGTSHPTDSLKQDCPIDPIKSMRTFLGTDSLFVDYGLSGEVFSSNTNAWHDFAEPFLSAPGPSQWEKVYTCKEAPLSATHFGVSPPVGAFTIDAPCAPIPGELIYHMFYYNVDDIWLVPLPEELTTSVGRCDNAADKSVRIDTLFDFRELSVRYRWADGVEGGERTIEIPGEYLAEAILPCTTIPIIVTIEEQDCGVESFIPNAFSPNFDGFNDRFGPFIDTNFPISNYSFQVFDRWGSLVFQTNQPDEAWDGRIGGNAMPTGVYVWQLQFEVEEPAGKRTYREQGDVMLVR